MTRLASAALLILVLGTGLAATPSRARAAPVSVTSILRVSLADEPETARKSAVT